MTTLCCRSSKRSSRWRETAGSSVTPVSTVSAVCTVSMLATSCLLRRIIRGRTLQAQRIASPGRIGLVSLGSRRLLTPQFRFSIWEGRKHLIVSRGSASAWMQSTVREVEQADQRGNTWVRSEILTGETSPVLQEDHGLRQRRALAPRILVSGDHLTPIEKDGEAYDIWAIPGSSPGEIDVYTATGGDVRRYTEKGGDEHIKLTRRNPVADGYKVGAVRAAGRRRSLKRI